MKNDRKKSVKERVANLFTYVKEIKSRLEPPTLDESKYEWRLKLTDLPDHPYIFTKPTEDYFFKVKRPKVIDCPTPPQEIQQWIKPSWKYIDKELDYLKSRNILNEDETSTTIYIEDFPEIEAKIETFKKTRDDWKKAEFPSEEVRKVFSILHEAKARIERDSDGIQLYLTEGVLIFNYQNMKVNHPLLFKEIAIELDGEKDEPEISITKSSTDSAMFISLLRKLDVSGSMLNTLKEEFSKLEIDPDDDKEKLFLKNLVHRLWSDGKFSENRISPSETPIIFLEQKLIIGRKESSFSEQIDNYIKKIHEIDVLPVAYQNMVGSFEEPKMSSLNGNGSTPQLPKSKKSYFLTKEYNIEQKKIINLLEATGCVSVQGPPGTGKSHTIANLVGHLLAKGQSVLISAHRSKALEVIRDQVVESILKSVNFGTRFLFGPRNASH